LRPLAARITKGANVLSSAFVWLLVSEDAVCFVFLTSTSTCYFFPSSAVAGLQFDFFENVLSGKIITTVIASPLQLLPG
jgi:hypothetical protein